MDPQYQFLTNRLAEVRMYKAAIADTALTIKDDPPQVESFMRDKHTNLGYEESMLEFMICNWDKTGKVKSPFDTLPSRVVSPPTETETDKLLFSRYKEYVCSLPIDKRQFHFSDGLEYFKNKNRDCFDFCSTALALGQRGGVVSGYDLWYVMWYGMWGTARYKISNYVAFKEFAKKYVN